MKENNLVTVYIPTHNRLGLLKRALSSIKEQTYQDIQVIVVNDGSSDGTKEFLNDFIKQNNVNNIIVFHNEKPKGACYSRNIAIENADGYYITGLDDDDYFLPNRIENFIAYANLLDTYSCISSAIVQVDNDVKKKVYFNHKNIINKDSLRYKNSVGNQVFTYTQRLKDLGGFDNNLKSCQDYDMWIRLVLHYGNIYNNGCEDYYMDVSCEHGRISTSAKRGLGIKSFCDKHKYFLDRNAFVKLNILSSFILNDRPRLKFIVSQPFYFFYCLFRTRF